MQTLLFDWSGTLVDDFSPTWYATNAVFKAYGLQEMSVAEFRQEFFLPYPDFYKKFVPGVPLEELEEVFVDAFAKSPQPVTLLEKSAETLVWLKEQGFRLMVVTSMGTKNFMKQAVEFGVYDLFEACYSGVLNKSDTMPQIIEKHGLDVSKCCYIGDMVHDIRTAHSVEMSSIAVLSGYDSVERLAKEKPTLIVENVPHLRKVVSYFM